MNNKYLDKSMKYLFTISALISIVCIGLISFFIFNESIPFIKSYGLNNFLFGNNWKPSDSPAIYGIFPMVLGSLIVTFGSLLIGVPIGIFTGVFLSYFVPKKYYNFLKNSINLMAGIPSIIYGFFGLTLIVPFIRTIFGGTGMSILSAIILLGIMILPTIINLSENAISSVPKSYYEGSIALGATHEASVFKAIIPAAKNGIISAVILGMGRAIGETTAIILVIGNQARLPKGISKGIRTLTTNIVMDMSYASGEHRQALIATAAILFIFILIVNLLFLFIKRRSSNE